MKRIKSPWYEIVWICVGTAALIGVLATGMFDMRESIGFVLMWAVLVGINVYSMVLYFRSPRRTVSAAASTGPTMPGLNSPCPCGSGKKYKRCCGAKSE
ncbi:MAG TPA: SEC-C metal-binding domain-containing protein [Desulfomonilaceae bacterium]|nr:SEC-C metal-binding domain-containing protein [Desulfomonilaceae bacterium]